MTSSTSTTEAWGPANDGAAEDAMPKGDGHVSRPSSDGSDDEKEKGDGKGQEEQEEDRAEVMRGRSLALFTVGMMAVVFMLCLDHYILGRVCSAWETA
jgi:hypothetical protein